MRNITLTVFANGMLETLFRPEEEEVVGGWRKVHNKSSMNCRQFKVL
jgi:hypothetical protein